MPKNDIDYSNTIIYKITCKDTIIKEVYVGHTTNFIQRKHAHKQCCINEKMPNYNCKLYKTIRDNGGWDNWTMEIVNFFNCTDNYEARKKEQEYFILLNATLNSIEPLHKTKVKDKCECCNIKFDNINLMDIHNKTKKHLKNLNISNKIQMSPKSPEKSSKYYCELCNYLSSNKKDYNKHILTVKHQNYVNVTNNISKQISKPTIKCDICEKIYYSRNGLWLHKKKCIQKPPPVNETLAQVPPKEQSVEPMVDASNNIIFELLKQNQEFKELIIEQNKQIIELAGKVGGNTINNTTNNNNNQFNLQFFLNEQCKDALNIEDFVKQIKLQLSDLDMIGRVGYVEGISKIFIRNLQELDVFKRPIHCSDLKRETLYVKDNDAWEKENGENNKIKRVIKQIECKNIKQIPKWQEVNPESDDYDSKKHLEYQNIVLQAMGGSTLEDDNKKQKQIIKHIAKEVVIDKTLSKGNA